MGGANADSDGIVALSQTDFTEDLRKASVPLLVVHGDDDQIVAYADSGLRRAALVQNGTRKPPAACRTECPRRKRRPSNADLLACVEE